MYKHRNEREKITTKNIMHSLSHGNVGELFNKSECVVGVHEQREIILKQSKEVHKHSFKYNERMNE